MLGGSINVRYVASKYSTVIIMPEVYISTCIVKIKTDASSVTVLIVILTDSEVPKVTGVRMSRTITL